MVAVQMADHHRVDGVRREAGPLHGEQRRRSAVEQNPRPVAVDEVAGVAARPGVEGVAGAEKRDPYRQVIILGSEVRAPLDESIARSGRSTKRSIDQVRVNRPSSRMTTSSAGSVGRRRRLQIVDDPRTEAR